MIFNDWSSVDPISDESLFALLLRVYCRSPHQSTAGGKCSEPKHSFANQHYDNLQWYIVDFSYSGEWVKLAGDFLKKETGRVPTCRFRAVALKSNDRTAPIAHYHYVQG